MNNIFRDEYTDFTFNGVRSSQMKVWITNSGDLQFRLTPEFSDTFVSPSFSNTQILNGTNITKSTFAVKCIAIDITMQEWRAIQRWLSPTAVGRLSFDFNEGTYYNAKIDKSISGTSFVKGGINNLGDKYIVEFSVGFVTVGDYAALGEVNVGILGKNFGDNIVIGIDSDGNSIEDEYKIESVSNNRYFMPSVSKLGDKLLANTFNSIGGKILKIQHKITDIALIFDFSLKDGKEIQPLYRINGMTSDNNKKQIQIKKTNAKGEDERDFFKDVDDEGYAYLSFYGENLFLYPLVDINSIDILNSDNNYAICNTGSYDLYPSLFLNAKSFSVKKNNEDYYSYNLSKNAIISVDGQNGFILSQGQPIENVSCSYKKNGIEYEHVLVDSYKNNGILNIECGKPQIIKGYYKESNPLTQTYKEGEGGGDNERTIGYINTFISPEKLNYDYHSNLAIHIFKDITNMQKFNTASYPIFIQEGNNNSYHFEFIDNYFTNDCYVYCVEKDGYYEYNIITQCKIEESVIKNTLALKGQGSTYFISACNYDTLTIETSRDEGDTTSNNFIYLQTRDAF